MKRSIRYLWSGFFVIFTLLFICCYTMRLVKGQAGKKSTFRLWKTLENGGIKQFQGYRDSKFIIDWANHLSSVENLGLHEPSSRVPHQSLTDFNHQHLVIYDLSLAVSMKLYQRNVCMWWGKVIFTISHKSATLNH